MRFLGKFRNKTTWIFEVFLINHTECIPEFLSFLTLTSRNFTTFSEMSESEDPLPSSILSCDYSATGDSPKPDSVGVGDAPFAFETDHEALRSNADYAALLRVMAALQAQKMQAVRDREKLIEARDKALADPIAFVKRLQVCMYTHYGV